MLPKEDLQLTRKIEPILRSNKSTNHKIKEIAVLVTEALAGSKKPPLALVMKSVLTDTQITEPLCLEIFKDLTTVSRYVADQSSGLIPKPPEIIDTLEKLRPGTTVHIRPRPSSLN